LKTIQDILKGVKVMKQEGDPGIRISNVCFDSRKVTAGCVFVATRGTVADGHAYIPIAVESGASAIVCEEMPVNFQ
jgi:UDP-N-acetylmuramoyl-L-alanyl-D-glutamate--2,6-diaminopimelate ligase